MSEVLLAPNLETEQLVQERLVRLLGGVAVRSETEPEPNTTSLFDTLRTLDSGDETACEHVKGRIGAELRTSVFEILYHHGHVSTVEVEHDETADAYRQHGFRLDEMYANGTMYDPDLLPAEWWRRLVETKNEVRLAVNRALLKAGFIFVEVSCFPDDINPEFADKYLGYHLATRKAILRTHRLNSAGNRIIETAPVAGVSPKGKAHDRWAARSVYAGLGADISVDSATEWIDNGVWVNESELPNGVASVVELWDSSVNNGKAYFGAWGVEGDYTSIREVSKQREARLDAELTQKVDELIPLLKESRSDKEVLLCLTEFAKNWATELTVEDESIDPNQFGPAAAQDIRLARYYYSTGDHETARAYMLSAQETAVIYVCGYRLAKERELSQAGEDQTEVRAISEFKDCDYISKECPLCHRRNARTHETATKIECRECKGFVKKEVVKAA